MHLSNWSSAVSVTFGIRVTLGRDQPDAYASAEDLAERVGFEPTGLAPDGFQDRLNRPLWHLSAREFVLNMRSLRRPGHCAMPRSARVVYRIGLPSTKSSDRPLWHLSELSRTVT